MVRTWAQKRHNGSHVDRKLELQCLFHCLAAQSNKAEVMKVVGRLFSILFNFRAVEGELTNSQSNDELLLFLVLKESIAASQNH